MKITRENFNTANFDVFSLFNDRWALVTAGTMENYNTMTIGWGAMGSIWGGPGSNKQILQIFVRENRKTFDLLQNNDCFTVCFFPEDKKKDLAALGRISGWENPEKVALTTLTPKDLGVSVGFEEAQLTFLCKKIYTQKLDLAQIPEAVVSRMYSETNPIHHVFFGEILDAFGETFGECIP